MNILFDQGTPVPLRRYLLEHTITTAYEQGWSHLMNGHLLDAAEQAGFDGFIFDTSKRANAFSIKFTRARSSRAAAA